MKKRNLFPLERLMLMHLNRAQFKLGADLTDATTVFGVHTGGHKKWADAHYCMAFIALRGLESRGLAAWSGQSRALGHRGYHYGLWKVTDKGAKLAAELVGQP